MSARFCVLDLHSKAKVFDLTSDITRNISVAKEKNYDARYFFLCNQEAEQLLILLLPGYTIFTFAGFDFDKELVSYKNKTSKQIHEKTF
ncbi:8056_t:CDS:2 [Funneliformis geosporum]|nr:8056_t:CDS:2 [Funneliformis geosporum]